jgi:hypothetical protein
MMTKDDFRRPKKMTIERVFVEEAQDDVCVRTLSARDLLSLRELAGSVSGELDSATFAYEVIVRSICDVDGELLFRDADEARELFGLSVAAFEKLSADIMRVSGLKVREGN